MKKKQKYADLARITIIWRADEVAEVLVLFKKGSQYTLCNIDEKHIFHATEMRLEQMIAEGAVLNSPLHKALL